MLQYGWTQKGSATHIAAAEQGDIDALELLIEAKEGPNLELADDWRGVGGNAETAIFRAALEGQVNTVAYLLEQGANPFFENELGQSCLWTAEKGGNSAVVQTIAGRGPSQS